MLTYYKYHRKRFPMYREPHGLHWYRATDICHLIYVQESTLGSLLAKIPNAHRMKIQWHLFGGHLGYVWCLDNVGVVMLVCQINTKPAYMFHTWFITTIVAKCRIHTPEEHHIVEAFERMQRDVVEAHTQYTQGHYKRVCAVTSVGLGLSADKLPIREPRQSTLK